MTHNTIKENHIRMDNDTFLRDAIPAMDALRPEAPPAPPQPMFGADQLPRGMDHLQVSPPPSAGDFIRPHDAAHRDQGR